MSAGLAFLLGGVAVLVLEAAAVGLIAWKILRTERRSDDRFWKFNKPRGDGDEV